MIRRLACLVLAVAFVTATPRAAGAAGVTDIAEFLDDDATLVVRADPDALLDTLALARKTNPEVATALLLVALGGRVLGLDLLSKAGWTKAGLDFDAPVMMSLAALDMAAADTLYQTLATSTGSRTGASKPAKVWWRSRIALGIKDSKRLDGTLQTLLGSATFDAHWVNDANREAIAAMLGAGTKAAKTILEKLAKNDVLAVIAVPFVDQLGFVQRRGDVLVIDLVSNFDQRPVDWSSDQKPLTAMLRRKPKAFARRIAAGVGASAVLADPGVSIWLDPERLVDLAVASKQAATLAYVAAGGSFAAAPDYETACAGFRELATTGPFVDAAATISAGKNAAHMEIVWGLRPVYQLAASIIVADDGLGRAGAMTDAVIAGGVNLAGLSALRALPRPAVLTGGKRAMLLAMGDCGPTAFGLVAGFGWPQLIGSLLDDVAGINDGAKLIVDSARNVAFAAKQIGPSRDDNIGAIEASFAIGAEHTLAHINDMVFGATKTVQGKTRSYTSWGRGKLRPYQWKTSAGQVVFGGGVGDQSVAWYLDHEQLAAKKTSTIAWLELDARSALRQLGGVAAMFDAIRRQLGGAVSKISATMELRGDTLVSSVDFLL